MPQVQPPSWLLAAGFLAVAGAFAVWLRVYLRHRDSWRYDVRAAWLRAGTYFALAWALAAATGTLATIAGNPIVFDGQSSRPIWLASTVAVTVVVVVGYWVIWPRGTEAHGRTVVIPDTILFGLAWGVSEGLVFASIWVAAYRTFDSVPAGRVWTALVVIVAVTAFNGFGHAVYWDVHVSPEHNIIDRNLDKVMYVHSPNLVLTTIYVTTFGNLAIWVGLQTLALLGSSVTMPFPTFRHPLPEDPMRPTLGPPSPFPPSLVGQTAVVTGAGAGLGRLAALRLAEAGARVFVLDRDREAAARAVAQIVTVGGRAETIRLDLADPGCVREAARHLLDATDRIDLLINNAGVFRTAPEAAPCGAEMTLAINHLGPFLLTHLLAERLTTSGARVLFVSSDAHWQARDPNPDDLSPDRFWPAGEADANAGFAAYNESKLLLTAAALEWADRFAGTGATVNVLTPGALVLTGIYDALGPVSRRLLGWLRPVLRSPDKAVRNYLYVATSPEVDGVNGWYFKDQRPITPSLQAQDPDFRRRVWSAACRQLGVTDPAAPSRTS